MFHKVNKFKKNSKADLNSKKSKAKTQESMVIIQLSKNYSIEKIEISCSLV